METRSPNLFEDEEEAKTFEEGLAYYAVASHTYPPPPPLLHVYDPHGVKRSYAEVEETGSDESENAENRMPRRKITPVGTWMSDGGGIIGEAWILCLLLPSAVALYHHCYYYH